MDEQRIKQALNTLADQAVPDNYDPTPELRGKISTAPRRPMRQSQPFRSGLRAAGLAVVFVMLAGIIFLFTPQGQGVAQAVARFFTFAGQDTLPLPTGQPTEPTPPTRTPAPTRIAELQVVTPGDSAPAVASYPTETPVSAAGAGVPVWNLSVEEAEQLAGFAVSTPAVLPPGYRLDNVIYNPGAGEVAQFYEFHPYSAGEMFILSQRATAPEDVIGQSAQVEQLTVGDTPVEYVRGGWFGEPGSGTESWSSGSIYHTYRWQAGDFYYALVFMFDEFDTWSSAYWTREGMIAMLEIILGLRADFPEQVNYNNLTSLEQAEEIAGYDLLVPSVLPEGFVFSRAMYEPNLERVILYYQPQEGTRAVSGVNLLVIQNPRGTSR